MAAELLRHPGAVSLPQTWSDARPKHLKSYRPSDVREALAHELSPAEAMAIATMIAGRFPNGGNNANPKAYMDDIAAALRRFPPCVAIKAGYPGEGISTTTNFLPTAHVVIEWCERELAGLQTIVAREDADRATVARRRIESYERELDALPTDAERIEWCKRQLDTLGRGPPPGFRTVIEWVERELANLITGRRTRKTREAKETVEAILARHKDLTRHMRREKTKEQLAADGNANLANLAKLLAEAKAFNEQYASRAIEDFEKRKSARPAPEPEPAGQPESASAPTGTSSLLIAALASGAFDS